MEPPMIEEKMSCVCTRMVMPTISWSELKDSRGLGFPGNCCLYFLSFQSAISECQHHVRLQIIWLLCHGIATVRMLNQCSHGNLKQSCVFLVSLSPSPACHLPGLTSKSLVLREGLVHIGIYCMFVRNKDSGSNTKWARLDEQVREFTYIIFIIYNIYYISLSIVLSSLGITWVIF